MKKTLALLAVIVFGFGMISCEADTSVEDTEALYLEMEATDDSEQESGERGNG